jgi:hypothetical protein
MNTKSYLFLNVCRGKSLGLIKVIVVDREIQYTEIS